MNPNVFYVVLYDCDLYPVYTSIHYRERSKAQHAFEYDYSLGFQYPDDPNRREYFRDIEDVAIIGIALIGWDSFTDKECLLAKKGLIPQSKPTHDSLKESIKGLIDSHHVIVTKHEPKR